MGGVRRFIGLVRFNTKAFTVSNVESGKERFRCVSRGKEKRSWSSGGMLIRGMGQEMRVGKVGKSGSVSFSPSMLVCVAKVC